MTKVLKLQHGIIEVNDKGVTCEASAYSKAGKILGLASAFSKRDDIIIYIN